MSKLEYRDQNDSRNKPGFNAVFTSDNKIISVSEYIETFLITRGYETTQQNRLKIADSLSHVPMRDRHSVSELDHWLDSQFKS